MCIRDRVETYQIPLNELDEKIIQIEKTIFLKDYSKVSLDCLLYTSDAADERSSVDLGGRRIIKKKKRKDTSGHYQRYDTTINNKSNIA